jgi:hypothetical protein
MFLRGNSMSARTDAFLAEIRAMPNFVAAAATDSKWGKHLDNIERGINAIDRRADDDPATIDILDRIHALLDRGDLSMKKRLLGLYKLLVEFRDIEGTRH